MLCSAHEAKRQKTWKPRMKKKRWGQWYPCSVGCSHVRTCLRHSCTLARSLFIAWFQSIYILTHAHLHIHTHHTHWQIFDQMVNRYKDIIWQNIELAHYFLILCWIFCFFCELWCSWYTRLVIYRITYFLSLRPHFSDTVTQDK